MDELNKMDVVEAVTDTVSDFTNSSNGIGDYIKGGLIGAGVTALGVVAYKYAIKPLWNKAKAKAKLLKAKRAKNENNIPRDVEEEYPIN